MKMLQIFQTFADHCSRPGFFDLPTWYRYLPVKHEEATNKCEVQFSLMNDAENKFSGTDLLLLGLGIVDILIRIAALVAVFFVMYGGIKYITSQGSPEGTKGGKDTIINALLGLAIAIVAAAVVSFIGGAIK